MVLCCIPVVGPFRGCDVETELRRPAIGADCLDFAVPIGVEGDHVPDLNRRPDVTDAGDVRQCAENLFREGETVDPFSAFVNRCPHDEVNFATDVGSQLVKGVSETVRQEERGRKKRDAQHHGQGCEGEPHLAARDVPECESEHRVSRLWP